jgi:hypothetical protein
LVKALQGPDPEIWIVRGKTWPPCMSPSACPGTQAPKNKRHHPGSPCRAVVCGPCGS